MKFITFGKNIVAVDKIDHIETKCSIYNQKDKTLATSRISMQLYTHKGTLYQNWDFDIQNQPSEATKDTVIAKFYKTRVNMNSASPKMYREYETFYNDAALELQPILLQNHTESLREHYRLLQLLVHEDKLK